MAVGIVAATAAPAHAQSAGNLTLDTFRPAMDSRGYFTVNASQVLGDKDVSFGLGSLDYGHHLLDLSMPAGCKANSAGCTSYTIDNILTATLVGAFGIHVGPAELEFGASVPFVIMNGDRGPDFVDPSGNTNFNENFGIQGQGLGNIGLHFKTRFLKTSKKPHVGLGVMASVYLPTASPTDSFLGENKVMAQFMGILDKEIGLQGRFRIALNGGIRLRPSGTVTFTDSDTNSGANDMAGNPIPVPVTGRSVTVGNEVPFGLGVAYAIAIQKFDVVAELNGSLPLATHENYQPLEAIAGVKLYLARNSFLALGGGRGLATDKGANPDARAFISIIFEPNIGDRDGDGIKDDVDQCPDDPEDFDGFQDEDGCPDP
nr:hypothetical protein [Kofleriaceae bacterium]